MINDICNANVAFGVVASAMHFAYAQLKAVPSTATIRYYSVASLRYTSLFTA